LLAERSPGELRRLLTALADGPPAGEPEDREQSCTALRLLARWGDASRVEETRERLPELLASGIFDGAEIGLDLGRLRDERLGEALEERARSARDGEAIGALFALGVRAGLDPRMFPVHEFEGFDLETEPWAGFRRLVLAGDPVGALVHASAAVPTEGVAWLGLCRDPRVLALLRRLREERRVYWPATAGLALAGDETARSELVAFLRDNRTCLLDDLYSPLYLVAMEADPAAIDLLIERIGENCCAACYAAWALGMRYPTLETSYSISNLLETRRRVRAWYARHRGRLVRSRIARGHVPR
jgi:hypothetical protein